MQTIKFIEEYDVPGVGRFAIEDYEDGAPAAQHFFPHTKHKRYHLWRNGCGIGQADTLTQALDLLVHHAKQILTVKRQELEGQLAVIQGAMALFGYETATALATFKVEHADTK